MGWVELGRVGLGPRFLNIVWIGLGWVKSKISKKIVHDITATDIRSGQDSQQT